MEENGFQVAQNEMGSPSERKKERTHPTRKHIRTTIIYEYITCEIITQRLRLCVSLCTDDEVCSLDLFVMSVTSAKWITKKNTFASVLFVQWMICYSMRQLRLVAVMVMALTQPSFRFHTQRFIIHSTI